MPEEISKLEAERDELLRTWKNPVEEEPLLFRLPGSDLRQARHETKSSHAKPRDRQLWLRFRDWIGR